MISCAPARRGQPSTSFQPVFTAFDVAWYLCEVLSLKADSQIGRVNIIESHLLPVA